MGFLIIALAQLVHSTEGICTKIFGKRHGDGGMIFSAMLSLFAMVYFVISKNGGWFFPIEIWFYGFIGCLAYALGFYFTFVAIKNGSYALSILILSYSGIFSIAYGLFFLEETASSLTFIGIALIFISMFFINYIKTNKSEKARVSPKWFFSIMVALIANGVLGIIIRMQQIRFENMCTNEFMIISLGGSFLFLLIGGIIKDAESFGYIVKNGILYAMCGGIANGITNFLILQSYLFIPISIASPINAGLKILFTVIISVILFKEKLTKRQVVGVICGAAGLLLLNV